MRQKRSDLKLRLCCGGGKDLKWFLRAAFIYFLSIELLELQLKTNNTLKASWASSSKRYKEFP